MQKHEREVFKIAQEAAAPAGIVVDFSQWAGSTHRKLVLHTADGRRRHTMVSSSPKNRDRTVANIRKWINRTVKELSRG